MSLKQHTINEDFFELENLISLEKHYPDEYKYSPVEAEVGDRVMMRVVVKNEKYKNLITMNKIIVLVCRKGAVCEGVVGSIEHETPFLKNGQKILFSSENIFKIRKKK